MASQPLPEPAALTVAILGGGISGLSCASHLLNSDTDRPIDITLFDTGRIRPGGRCASRLKGDKPASGRNAANRRPCDDVNTPAGDDNHDNLHIATMLTQSAQSRDRIISTGPVDHAAQIVSVPGNIDSSVDSNDYVCFQDQLNQWLQEGVLKRYPEGSVCELMSNSNNDSQSTKATLHPLEGEMYYGNGGMSSVPLAIRDSCISRSDDTSNPHAFRIMQDVWVSPSNGVKYIGNNNSKDGNQNYSQPQWELKAGSKSLGKYHHLIIAHNGKCADRIMSKTPAKAFHSLLRTKFAPIVPQWGGREMTLNSIYSLVFAIKTAKSDDGAFSSCVAHALKKLSTDTSKDIYTVMMKNDSNLRLLSSNTLKHSHVQNPSSASNIEVYTLLSSASFGKQYKGPQENLPSDLMETVTLKMLHSLEKALCIQPGMLVRDVVDLKLQLWGAAVPLNTWTVTGEQGGFVYDAQYNVGACGDWMLDPSIAGAWESGRRLARWIARREQRSVGLPNLEMDTNEGGKFVPSRAALESGIGTVPSTPNSTFEFPVNNYNGEGRGSSSFISGGRGSGSYNRSRNARGGGRNFSAKNGNRGRGRVNNKNGGRAINIPASSQQ